MDKSAEVAGPKGVMGRIWDPRLKSAVWCVVTFFLADFLMRFVFLDQRMVNAELSPKALITLVVPRLRDEDRALYLEKLEALDPILEEVVPKVVDAVSDVEVPRQSGGAAWDTEDFSYRLSAIARRLDIFAVLDRVQKSTGTRHLIEARLGESINGYAVTDLSLKGITLVGEDNKTVRLTLFEPTSQDTNIDKKAP